MLWLMKSRVQVFSYLVVFFAILVFPRVGIAGLDPGDYEFTILFDGLHRSYQVHVPESYRGDPVPLVLDFHVWTSNSNQQRSISGFLEKSEEKGFIVAWPQGWGELPSWNAVSCCGAAMVANLDDVGLAVAIVDEIVSMTGIDRDHVYATGLSNGGALSHYLACEAADVFAAVAPVSYPLPVWYDEQCQPQRPIAVIHFHGFHDIFVPYLDLRPNLVRSAPESFHDWASINDCPDRPTTTYQENLSFCRTYDQCLNDVEVTLCSISGGHVLYFNRGDIDIAAIAWEFLSQFSLSGP